jgi:hypothetical protein
MLALVGKKANEPACGVAKPTDLVLTAFPGNGQ